MTHPMRARITAAGRATRVDVYDDIGGGFFGGLSAQDFAGSLAGVKGPLDVHINSAGGDVFDGLAIAEAIRRHKGKVTTVVDGLAASIASVIAQAGRERVMAPGSMLMIHDAFAPEIGNAAEHRKMADLLDKASDNLAGQYAARAGGTAEQWRAAMRDETWYTAGEAVDAGLADSVAGHDAVLPDGLDLAAFAAPGRIMAALRTLPRAAVHVPYDPDGDGDDDSTPEGDTDHDYWDADGNQIQDLPGRPLHGSHSPAGLTADDIRAIIRDELRLRDADKYSADDRKRMATAGQAMPDGSYPIADAEDLGRAMHAVGRGGADHDAIRAHIIKRAKALGLSSEIPDNWNADGSLQDGSSNHTAPDIAGFAASFRSAFKEASNA